jgi:hypothetical protein
MYGIINKTIEEFVLTNYSEEIWNSIKSKSNISIDFFISSEVYNDDITYSLATNLAEETKLSIGEILEKLGEFWILKTGREKYGYLLESGGSNLKEFLLNLPLFHNRVLMIYPKITPPSFRISEIKDNSLHLHYYSRRKNLEDFLKGIILGLGKMFLTPVTFEEIKSEHTEKFKTFLIAWK